MAGLRYVDTHIHLDGPEFDPDRDEVVQRARDAGAVMVMVPSLDLGSVGTVLETCGRYPGYAFPMLGLHPEEVRADWRDVLERMEAMLGDPAHPFVAVGEVGLDFYWSREFEAEQLLAFERQVQWAVEYGLPLMIHCRKGQNEMVRILRKYAGGLCGGVFHCFTGNAREAGELLGFEGFALGIGGVLTFKKSGLPETLLSVPLERTVLETDAPYMAPVPMRGKRNESAFIVHVLDRMAQCYGVDRDVVAETTTATVGRIFTRLPMV